MGSKWKIPGGAMTVLNKYHHGGKPPEDAVNIMRGTPYGNPFVIGRDGDRREVIAKYRRWLWEKITQDKAYAGLIKRLYGQNLCCCCAPAPCHGDVLEAAAKWLNRKATT
jgi:hypothetical protein